MLIVFISFNSYVKQQMIYKKMISFISNNNLNQTVNKLDFLCSWIIISSASYKVDLLFHSCHK